MACDFKPGYYAANDLMVAQRQFLEHGRNPKVSLRNLAECNQMTYSCCQKVDGTTGICTVMERPADSDEIIKWLKKLPREIEHNGERLAAISLKVCKRWEVPKRPNQVMTI